MKLRSLHTTKILEFYAPDFRQAMENETGKII